MKRTAALVSIFIGLILTYGVVTTKAQVSTQYRADIPFDFSIKGVNYAAGEYIIGPVSANSSSSALACTNKETGKTRILGVLMASSAGRSNESNGTLRFARVNGHYILAEVVTPTFEKKFMKLPKTRDLARTGEYPKEVVVKLNW